MELPLTQHPEDVIPTLNFNQLAKRGLPPFSLGVPSILQAPNQAEPRPDLLD